MQFGIRHRKADLVSADSIGAHTRIEFAGMEVVDAKVVDIVVVVDSPSAVVEAALGVVA
jgi:hypothetical protein